MEKSMVHVLKSFCWIDFSKHKNMFAFSINSQHWCRFFKSFFIEDKGLPVLHIQYDVCWWPGDARSLVCLEYSVISIRRGNSTIFPPKYSSKHSIARPWGWGMGCPLTHWGRVTHIYNGKLHNNWFRNGLSPGRRQAIIWTNAGILLIGPLETTFSEI